MRIDRSFAPITVIIETEHDKAFMLEVIDKALQQRDSERGVLSRFRPLHEDSFYQKAQYFRKQIT
jgi:hypothetical protein